MIQGMIYHLVRFILSLRYQVTVKNFPKNHPAKKVLILPNHPALVDPIILFSVLYKKFHQRALADENRINIPGCRKIIKLFRTIAMPDPDDLSQKKETILAAIEEVAKTLRSGDNVLLYPSGRLYRYKREDLRSNSSVEILLKSVPDLKILLVRAKGLWGSRLSWAKGKSPKLFSVAPRFLVCLVANAIFFIPRRKVTVEFLELPLEKALTLDRQKLNRFLEEFYNEEEEFNTAIPDFWWQGSTPQRLPEFVAPQTRADLSGIPVKTIEAIKEKIKELTGAKDPQIGDNLSQNLGMDSLALAELMGWVGEEFGKTIDNLEGLNTVSDVILVASGQSLKKEIVNKEIPQEWFTSLPKNGLYIPKVKSIPEAFLEHSYTQPNRTLIADDLSGLRTSRQLRLTVTLLHQKIIPLEGKNIGILLPATVAATTVYMATLFANKVPTMINWTVGTSVLQSTLESVHVKTIITSKKLIEKLKATGIDLAALPFNWVYLEDLAKTITAREKICGLISVHLPWRTLKAPPLSNEPAVILFTSGSEAKPKAVPLSHANLLQNAHDSLVCAKVPPETKILGMLPPFHSFGLLTGIILPTCCGIQVVYHANPTESIILASLIERYKATLLLSTPTFINGILRIADKAQLQSLRLIITGAEKCSDQTYQKLHEYCPAATIAEGYGITECSPVVSLNDPESPVWGSLGKIIPSLEYRIVHPEKMPLVSTEETGLLLVRGPSIFAGYLNHTGPSPFVEFEGKQWYNTGDLVKKGPHDVLIFAGRLKRFVKIAGEMISLMAVEEVLSSHYPPGDEGPRVAVEAANADTQPELILFATIPLERDEVNTLIRASGLSGLYNIRRVEKIKSIPILGTGKTDYKFLKTLL